MRSSSSRQPLLILIAFSVCSISIVYQVLSGFHVVLFTVLIQQGDLTLVVPNNTTTTTTSILVERGRTFSPPIDLEIQERPPIRLALNRNEFFLRSEAIPSSPSNTTDAPKHQRIKESVRESPPLLPPPSRPTLVLHIGPHKTATSTIQCELTHYRSFLREKGNVTFLGRQYNECKGKKKKPSVQLYDMDTRGLVKCL